MNIYKFLKGLEPDDKERLIHQIWDFSDTEIEGTHDFIQRIFPLNEPSTMSLNKFYVEDSKLIERIRTDPIITSNFLAYFKVNTLIFELRYYLLINFSLLIQ